MKTIFLTGATGFLGSHLLRKLLDSTSKKAFEMTGYCPKLSSFDGIMLESKALIDVSRKA